MTEFDFYKIDKLDENLYVVREQYHKECHNFNIFVVTGSEKVGVFDSGMGVTSGLRRYIEENISGDKPIACYMTHGDLDHIGGADLFDEVYVDHRDLNKLDWNINVARRFSDLAVFSKNDPALQEFCRDKYVRNENIREKIRDIVEGDVIDLGGEVFEVYAMPGHTDGSLAYFNRARNYCFVGDATIANFQRCKDFDEAVRCYEHLVEVLPEDVTLYNAHKFYTQPRSVIEGYIKCFKEILDWKNEGDERDWVIFPMVDPEELTYDVWAHKCGDIVVPYNRNILPKKA